MTFDTTVDDMMVSIKQSKKSVSACQLAVVLGFKEEINSYRGTILRVGRFVEMMQSF